MIKLDDDKISEQYGYLKVGFNSPYNSYSGYDENGPFLFNED